jgi:hypothetical protein
MKKAHHVTGYRQGLSRARPGFAITAGAIGDDLDRPIIHTGAWLTQQDLADAVACGAITPGTIVQEERGGRRGRHFHVRRGMLVQCTYDGKPMPGGRVLLVLPTRYGIRLQEVSELEAVGQLKQSASPRLEGALL